jgi:hypothetical protein
MYKQNNITMLPIIEAELGSTSVVSAIMSFFIGMRDRVYAAAGGDTSMGIGGVCGGGVDEGDGGSSAGEVDPGGGTASEGDEEIGWNIMRYLVTLLVLLCMAPLAYFRGRLGTLRPREHSASLYTNALALISSLYYTHAPQLPHASPPTRAPHIYVSSPSPGRLLASLQVPFRACEGYFQ